MSAFPEPGLNVVPWRIAAAGVNLCDRCRTSYGAARFCDGCLRQADADLAEKRGILFPQAYDAPDVLSAIA
jgi:hypothetical protein